MSDKETKLNNPTPGYQISEGDTVTGKYHGVEFHGTVMHRRTHSINRNQTELTVKLSYSINVYGADRHQIILSVDDNGECV